MADSMTVADIATLLEAEVEGDGSTLVTGLASIREAADGDLTFVANSKYAADAAETKATAVIVPRNWKRPCSTTMLRVDNPDEAFTRVASAFAPRSPDYPAGIHPSAVVADDAELGEGVHVGPLCIIESGVRIGQGTVLMGGSFVGHDTTIGLDCKIYPNVSLRERLKIGDRVFIHDGTVVGSDGFGYTVDDKGVRTKIPQIGIVEIANDVEIGANVAIDRARFGRTYIGNGVKIDNLVQIAHNVVIEDHAVIVAQVGIAGSSEIGPHAILAGQVGVAGHLKVGKGAVVAAQSGVWQDVPEGTQVFGYPALPQKEAMSIQRQLRKLPQLKERVVELEEKLKQSDK